MVLALVADRAESFTQFLTVILVFLLVLALTYLTTRFVGNYQKARSVNRNFDVIETYKITNGKYLQIVRIGEKYVVIGIGKDNVTSICELSADDIKPVPEQSVQSVEAFRSILDKAKERIGKGGKNEK
jgi:flagellar protein FliO/FliZ